MGSEDGVACIPRRGLDRGRIVILQGKGSESVVTAMLAYQ